MWWQQRVPLSWRGGQGTTSRVSSLLLWIPGMEIRPQAWEARANTGHLAGLFFPRISLVTLLGLEIFLHLLFWSPSETRKGFLGEPLERQWNNYPMVHTTNVCWPTDYVFNTQQLHVGVQGRLEDVNKDNKGPPLVMPNKESINLNLSTFSNSPGEVALRLHTELQECVEDQSPAWLSSSCVKTHLGDLVPG